MLNDLVIQATSPGGILAFILGISTALAYHGWIKPWWCKRRGIKLGYRVSIRITNLIIVVIALSAIWTGTKVIDLANHVAMCQKEFNTAIVQSRKVTEQNDDLSIEQRFIVFYWIHDIVFPPEPYAGMDPSDLRRQSWGVARTIQADGDFRKSIDRQEEIVKNRPVLPDPTCGRE